MQKEKKLTGEKEITIPCGTFCSKNCADGCIYWNPYDRKDDGRQWCEYYDTYFYPNDRNGCFNFKG